MLRGLLFASLHVACTSPSSGDDVVGPFTGPRQRYVVDSIQLPMTNTDARVLGADLNGDTTVDNQLGMVISTLVGTGNITQHGPSMIAAGAIASSVMIQADDVSDDPSVAVTFYGYDGAPATHVGGRFDEGAFSSNRTATTEVPGDAIAVLPIFDDADPSPISLVGLQIELVPDGDGFIAAISGGVLPDEALDHAHAGIRAQLAVDPDGHRLMLGLLDANKDWQVSFEEFSTNDLIESLFAPDIMVGDRAALSIGFHVHLTPCPAGSCSDGPPADACNDRVHDGDETDIDCGGSTCRACVGGEACSVAGDCESNACDAGRCRVATCDDQVRDGFEAGVDCGGPCSTGCAIGARCYNNQDCASGECGEPCTDPDPFNCIDWDGGYDVCYPPQP